MSSTLLLALQVAWPLVFAGRTPGKRALDVVLAPNGSAIANAAGIPKLKEEKSKNYSIGMTLSPSNALSVTADVYRINIDDRIVLSGRFDAGNYPSLGTALELLGVGQAQFFEIEILPAQSNLVGQRHQFPMIAHQRPEEIRQLFERRLGAPGVEPGAVDRHLVVEQTAARIPFDAGGGIGIGQRHADGVA